MNTPTLEELAACITAQNVRDLPLPDNDPDEDGVFSYKGSNTLLPAPWLRDTLMNAGTDCPFELIPMVIIAAKAYDDLHPDLDELSKASVHAEDFCCWAWGAGANRVKETKLNINADDGELEAYRLTRHLDCITGAVAAVTAVTAAGAETDNAEVLKQLTASIARQSEEAATSNQLRKDEIERKKDYDVEKKDRTKKFLHPSVLKMLIHALASSRLEIDTELTSSCKKFLNASSQGHAEQELSHQFDTLNLLDVCFAPGVIQNMYLGEFTYGNSCCPSNFTVFAFFEQPPLSNSKQQSYLTCHLIHENGHKQLLDEVKASLKQEVVVPKDFTTLGMQLQYFVGAVEILFGADSISRVELRKLLLQIARYKKQFRDMIALDEWFAPRFLYAVDKQVQLFLTEFKLAETRLKVNDRHLDFTDIIQTVLYGTFTMSLPPTFQKVDSEFAGTKRAGDKTDKDADGKKQKSDKSDKPEKKQEKQVIVKNPSQHEDFKMKLGESWKKNFKTSNVNDRPTWDGEKSTKMCLCWHVLGECFEGCDRKESHVPKDMIPTDKVTGMCAFIAKCRGE